MRHTFGKLIGKHNSYSRVRIQVERIKNGEEYNIKITWYLWCECGKYIGTKTKIDDNSYKKSELKNRMKEIIDYCSKHYSEKYPNIIIDNKERKPDDTTF